MIRAIEGFGAKSHLHTSRLLRLSEHLPLIVEVVDNTENIQRAIPMLDDMISDGLVTMEKVQVLLYRAGDPPPQNR